MDNYTMIQNAGKRRPDIERAGFAALSRADQADRWAAWQASADMPRAGAETTYTYDAMDEYGQGDAYTDEAHAMRDAERRAEAPLRRDDAWRESDVRSQRQMSRDDAWRDSGIREQRPMNRDNAWREDDIREQRQMSRDDYRAAEPPAPPKRSFALYNGILERHAQVFGKHM